MTVSQQTRDMDPMLVYWCIKDHSLSETLGDSPALSQCWPNVSESEPILIQRWDYDPFNVEWAWQPGLCTINDLTVAYTVIKFLY